MISTGGKAKGTANIGWRKKIKFFFYPFGFKNTTLPHFTTFVPKPDSIQVKNPFSKGSTLIITWGQELKSSTKY